jgi:hypothetical protein
MVKIALLLIIVAVIAGILWRLRHGHRVRRRQPSRLSSRQSVHPGPAGQLETLRLNRNYWGVEIRSGICKASKELTGRQFPFDEAPALPLADCAVNLCTCTYLGLWERRKWHRRTQFDRRNSIRYLQNHPDRRSHRDRRKIDVWRNLKW